MFHDAAKKRAQFKKSSAALTNRNRYEMQLLMLNPIVTTG